nr:ankyrin repeat domain-containing protein [Spirochaetota bacterium]
MIYRYLPLLFVALAAACSVKSEISRQFVAAVAKGDTARVNGLIARGADVNAREDAGSGRTALIIAAEEDYADIASVLVSRGADVNARSGDGSTALMNAAGEGNLEIARLLLSKGASVDEADNTGQTALIKAAASGELEAVELLLGAGAG